MLSIHDLVVSEIVRCDTLQSIDSWYWWNGWECIPTQNEVWLIEVNSCTIECHLRMDVYLSTNSVNI